MRMRTLGIVMTIIIATGSLTVAQVPGAAAARASQFAVPRSVSMMADLAYQQVNGKSLHLDLFVPKVGSSRLPTVVFFHGGGWSRGNKNQFWSQAAHLAEHGYVAATVEYRLAPAARFPAQLNDALAAVKWLRTHASKYRVDSNRVAVAGGSAGGHLASLLGMNSWNGTDWSGVPADGRVQAVVAFNPVLDLRPPATPPGPAEPGLLGVSFDENPSLWRDASPVSHVGKAAAPFLLLHGTSDELVPYAQSVTMLRLLQKAGVTAELFTADGAGHGFFNAAPWYEPTVARMQEFLDRLLR